MSSSKAAWGIEVGAYGIKAVRLERVGDEAKLTDFAVIPHKKVLTTPDIDQDEMIRLALGQFVSQKSVQGERAVVSIPGNAAFARFAKLPPVEPRKVPDIVKFEAVQQIPFPIDEVEWDYETVQASDSPEIEVGIFAITKERLGQRLALYQELGINPDIVTLSPLAVFNALTYDLGLRDAKKPIVFLDIGTTATDVVVADEGRCWIRTFPLGGTHFTEAIAESFKLTYGKADALKQESATSKYAKQIMQAMKPVFTDLLSDVQKSLNYYQQLHRGVALDEIVGLGSTFKIPGLRKFLSQQLNIEVKRLDEFARIRVEGREAADFAANTVNMGTAYGLALQGIGLATIDINLAPVKALREQMWASKTKWFAAAATLAIVAGGAFFLRGILDRSALDSSDAASTENQVQMVVQQGKRYKSEYQALEQQSNLGFTAENLRRLTDDRRVWPQLIDDTTEALRSGGPQAELLGESHAAIMKIPAGERKAISLLDLKGNYKYVDGKRRIDVEMDVEFSNRDRQEFLNDTVVQWLRDHADVERPGVPYRILKDSINLNAEKIASFDVDESGKGKGMDRPVETADSGPSSERSGSAQGERSGATGAGPGGGQLPGKRTRDPNKTIERPGSRGFGSSSDNAPPDAGAADPTDSQPKVNAPATGAGSAGEAENSKFNIGDLAPIAGRPPLYQKGDKYHRGRVTFTIELAPPAGGSPAAAAVEEKKAS
ncbi:MAG: type IV pilus assembly protein PilM [Phycisphaerae bacterium]|nr:type IV pilus assembly protein PilM [Phycisphaerae bacterium]